MKTLLQSLFILWIICNVLYTQDVWGQTATGVTKKKLNSIEYMPNKGQCHPDVLYYFESATGPVYITRNYIQFASFEPETEAMYQARKEKTKNGEPVTRNVHRWNLSLKGSNPNFTIKTAGKQGTSYNFFYGTDQNKWISNLHAFSEVILENIYEGIDMKFYTNKNYAQGLEYDFIVKPGADYKKIKMKFEGLDGLDVNVRGEIEAQIRWGKIIYALPKTYQESGYQDISAVFAKADNETINIQVDESKIDKNKALIIDPTILWGTYVEPSDAGGNWDSYAFASASNDCGEVYVAGQGDRSPTSTYIQGAGGLDQVDTNYDPCIYKMSADGDSIKAFTYIGIGGGVSGSGTSGFYDIDLFPDGRVIAVGRVRTTAAADYPTTASPTAFQAIASSATNRGIITVLNASLSSNLYSSMFTGATSGRLYSVAVLNNSTYFVGGYVEGTFSHVNATADNTSAAQEGVIGRFTDYNTKDWITYIGGDGNDWVSSIKLNKDKSKLVFGGETYNNTNFPTRVNPADNTFSGTSEGFVGYLPISSTPPSVFSLLSYIGGGTGLETGITVVADDTYLYCMGATESTTFPGIAVGTSFDATHGGGTFDMFVSRIALSGGTTGFVSTFYGGGGDDRGGNMVLQNNGDIFFFSSLGSSFAGTEATNLPNTIPASDYHDNTQAGSLDIGIGSFKSDLSALYFGSFIGGTGDDYTGVNGGLETDGHLSYNPNTGVLLLATTTHSTNIPTTVIKNAFDSAPSSINDKHLVVKMILFDDYDYGDAPNSYDTLSTYNPARHAVATTICLGTSNTNIDKEGAKQPSILANGDDILDIAAGCSSSPTDDEGAAIPIDMKVDDANYNLTVNIYKTVAGTATLNGWIDFDKNGKFESDEYATATTTTTTGSTTLNLSWTLTGKVCGTDILPGSTYMRLRFTNAATLIDNIATTNIDERSIGLEANGEVEDYVVNILGKDFGDLAAGYGNPTAYTNTDSNGDNRPEAIGSLWLGSFIDYDCTTQYSTNADGETIGDDGVSLTGTPADIGETLTFNITANSNGALANNHIGLWIDWDDNGSFDEFSAHTVSTASPATINVAKTVPTGAVEGFKYRVMVRPNAAGAFNSTDYNTTVTNGEIEDYKASPSTLPIQLLFFTGYLENKESILNWQTATEVNNKEFLVEHSIDGRVFETIGTVRGHGNTTEAHSYRFIHSNPIVGVNYYRLRQIDFGGEYFYSNVLSLILKDNKGGILNIAPVPADETATIIYQANQTTTVHFAVLNSIGQYVRSFQYDITEGVHNLNLDIANLPSGTYILQAAENTRATYLKFVVK